MRYVTLTPPFLLGVCLPDLEWGNEDIGLICLIALFQVLKKKVMKVPCKLVKIIYKNVKQMFS